MDQIAPALKWMKKNVFWLGCGFLSIAMVAMWFVATIAIAKETEDNERDVKSNITTAEGILRVTSTEVGDEIAHPNSTTEEGMKQEMSKTIDSMIEAWRYRENAQKEILIWPAVVDHERFAQIFGRYNPAETFPTNWAENQELKQVMDSLLLLYRKRIPDHMINLCGDDLLRTRWNFDPKYMDPADLTEPDESEFGPGLGSGGLGPGLGGGGRGGLGGGLGGFGAPGEEEGIDMNQYAVIWSDKNQEFWNQKLTRFQGRDDNNRPTNDPTPLQVYMLQQDLWLLEAMFKIIREINGNSNANDLSDIKQIDHVVFGREVGGKLGSLTPVDRRLGDPTAAVAAADPMGSLRGDGDEPGFEEPDLGGMFGRDGPGGPGVGGGGSGSYAGKLPYHDRYVDVNFEPLDQDVVRQVIEGTQLPDANLELIVAKRVPVRIALRMDERRIADFMAACANSPFAFEISQVRWNKHTPGGDEIAFDAGAGEDDRIGGMGMGLDGAPGGEALVAKPVEVRTNYDVNVEFYGIVKIYNPVRAKFLREAAGLGTDGVDPNAAAAAPANSTAGDSTP